MQILNPVSRPPIPARPPAPRLQGLAGVRIGLLDNGKPHAGRLLERIGEVLAARYAVAGLVSGVKPNAWVEVPEAERDRLLACDAVVTALGD